jgi:hypothetical protein
MHKIISTDEKYEQNMQKIYDKYSQNETICKKMIMHKYAGNMHKIYRKYAQKMQEIFIKFVTNMQKTLEMCKMGK